MLIAMSRVNASNFRPIRCPRCAGRPTVQNAVELRPGFEYLTLRCVDCGLVYDAQVAGYQLRSAHPPGDPRNVPSSKRRLRKGA
jgi:hypothetical protein